MEVVRCNGRYFVNFPLNKRLIINYKTKEELEIFDIMLEKLIDETDPENAKGVNILAYKAKRVKNNEIVIGSFMSFSMISCDSDGWPYIENKLKT